MKDHQLNSNNATMQSEAIAMVVRKDLGLSTDQKEVPVSMAELHIWLAHKISGLLDRDPARLIQALYRIDVNEDEVRRAFAGMDNIAETLSSLIIRRVQQKIVTRQKYSGTRS